MKTIENLSFAGESYEQPFHHSITIAVKTVKKNRIKPECPSTTKSSDMRQAPQRVHCPQNGLRPTSTSQRKH